MSSEPVHPSNSPPVNEGQNPRHGYYVTPRMEM